MSGEPKWLRNARAVDRENAEAFTRLLEVRRRLRQEAERAARLSAAPNDAWAQCADELQTLFAKLDANMPAFRRALNDGSGVRASDPTNNERSESDG